MIKMQVIGNLGKDCVVNTVNGKNVINFTVAHTEKYRDSAGNNQEKTTWVIVLIGQTEPLLHLTFKKVNRYLWKVLRKCAALPAMMELRVLHFLFA